MRAPALTGLSGELAAVDGIARDAGRGRGRAAAVVAPAGYGKTRLVREAITLA